MPKILIGRPQKCFNASRKREGGYWHFDMEAFYNTLETVLKDKGIEYSVTEGLPTRIIEKFGTISLCYHSKGKYKNVWHIKKGCVPGYLYFDKTGYSGWSEMAKRYTEPDIDDATCLKVKSFVDEEYIDLNLSKVAQPETANIPNHPYVLVLGQQPYDSVQKLAYIPTIRLSQVVSEVYKGTKYAVYTKPHPCSVTKRVKQYGKVIEGSLHDLIKHAKAIYTTNSGSGFEALFHLKHVFVSANCEYKWAAHTIKNKQDIIESIDKLDELVDQRAILKFLYYAFNEHFVDAYSYNAIWKKVKRTLNEYET